MSQRGNSSFSGVVTKTVLSADLLRPICTALAELSKGDKEAVHLYAVYSARVLAAEGLSIDCMGTRNGRPSVLHAVSNAAQDLRKMGILVGSPATKLTALGWDTLTDWETKFPALKGTRKAAPKAPREPKVTKTVTAPTPIQAETAPVVPEMSLPTTAIVVDPKDPEVTVRSALTDFLREDQEFLAGFSDEGYGLSKYVQSDLGKAVFKAIDRRNLTSRWIAEHHDLGPILVQHLICKLEMSRRMGVIKDHVQVFLLRLIERDTLAPYLMAGKKVQIGVLRVWAYHSACTEMRSWGVDASLRTSRGAKTNRDRMADAGKLPTVVIHSVDSVIERRYEIEDGEFVGELYNPNLQSAEDKIISAETIENARSLILRKMGNGAKYMALFDAALDGEKRTGLAAQAGVSRSQMAVMLTKIREFLRKEDVID
jgi:hypothetical protein